MKHEANDAINKTVVDAYGRVDRLANKHGWWAETFSWFGLMPLAGIVVAGTALVVWRISTSGKKRSTDSNETGSPQ